MSLTLNMSATQQRTISFIIGDYMAQTFKQLQLRDDLSEDATKMINDIKSISSINAYVGELATRAPKARPKKVLSDEDIALRDEAKEARKVERIRLREEKKALKKLERDQARAAKKAAAGPGWTTKEMTDSEGNIMKGKNGASLRVAKRKDTERGAWPKDQVAMKVSENWTDSDKAVFESKFGKPFDMKSLKKEETPNMAQILTQAAKPEVLQTVEPVVLVKPVETKTPNAIISASKKEKLVEKQRKRNEKKAKLAAMKEKNAKVAALKEEKRIAEEKRITEEKRIAEEKHISEENPGETKSNSNQDELEYSEDEDDDTPKPWSHHSYTGEEDIFKDEDNGVYHYNADEDDYEIIGFYYEDAEGDIDADTLQLD